MTLIDSAVTGAGGPHIGILTLGLAGTNSTGSLGMEWPQRLQFTSNHCETAWLARRDGLKLLKHTHRRSKHSHCGAGWLKSKWRLG